MSAVSPTDGTHPHCGHSRDASNGQQLVLINNKIRKTAVRLAPLLGADGVRAATTSAWVLLAAPARWCGGRAWVGLLNAPFPNLGSRAGAQPETETIRAQPKLTPNTDWFEIHTSGISVCDCPNVHLAVVQICSKHLLRNRKKNESDPDLLCEDHLMKPGSCSVLVGRLVLPEVEVKVKLPDVSPLETSSSWERCVSAFLQAKQSERD